MQILIEIPDDEYKMLVNPYQWNEAQCMRLKRIVINGTVIPKNHGRLVDADQIINVIKEIYDASPVKTLVTSADMYFLKKVLDNSNVIIEAEKEIKE